MEVDTLPPCNIEKLDAVKMDEDEESPDGDHLSLVSNLSRCTGSAMYTFGDNIVQCSIFGPNPMPSSQNLLKRNYFNVYLYPLGKINNMTKDKSLTYNEYFFKRTFGPVVFHASLPRSRTYMVLNEIERGSSFMSTALNAASMALIDSGYALNYCIGACGMIVDSADGQLYTDKQYRDKFARLVKTFEPQRVTFETPDNTIKATFCTVISNTNLRPVAFVAEGKFSLNQVFQVHQKSVEPVASFFKYAKDFVGNRFV